MRHGSWLAGVVLAVGLVGACGSVSLSPDGGSTGTAGSGHGDGAAGASAGAAGSGAAGSTTTGGAGAAAAGATGAAGAAAGATGEAGATAGTSGAAGATAGTSGAAGATAGTSGAAGATVSAYTLTVHRGGTGSGAVSSNVGGINCGATCSAMINSGVMVTLTAAPATGSTFGGWSGGGCSGTGTCQVTVTAAAEVTATFTLSQYAISVQKTGTGTGTVTSNAAGINCGATCSASFNYNTQVVLTASPSSDSTFTGWSGGGCSGTSTCVVTVTAATAVTATFTSTAPVPILRWTFDTNGANSGSLAGYALTMNGTTFVAGKVGAGAAQFGSGGYSFVNGTRAVLDAYPQYTIAYWVNATASVNTQNSFLDFNNRSTAPYGGLQLSYYSATQYSICVATTTSSYLTGSCPVFNAPSSNAWHHVIVRYAGTGTGAGQGAGVDVYVDDVLVKSVANDNNNDPVFSAGMPDAFYVGTAGTTVDDLRIYNTTFTVANQCTQIIGGTWTGSACTLP